jgi:RNA polymerase sigma factor (sigma-70 family)
MNPEPRPLLVASADRLFAEAAARYIERTAGASVVIERDGVRALMTIARLEPSAVLVLGDLERLPAQAFARRVRARWPDIPLVILVSAHDGDGVLPEGAGGPAVLEALSTPPQPRDDSRESVRSDELVRLQSLTERERAILLLLGRGLEFDEIAQRLEISEHTVRTHLQNLYRKLDIHSRLDIVRLVARHGLITAWGDVG